MREWILTLAFVFISLHPAVTLAQPANTPAPRPTDTPQKTLDTFCEAVRTENWQAEYLTYSNMLRSRFTYMLIRAVDELCNEADLMEKASQTLELHKVPDEAFTNFPALRSVNQALTPEEFQQELQNRLNHWKKDIFPKVEHWPELISELQPLLIENYQRHETNPTHLSQTGFVQHFRFHYFEAATDLTLSPQKAKANIIAVVRDASWESTEMEGEAESVEQASFVDRLKGKISAAFYGKRIRRPKESVQLILEDSEWRIDSIPYR